MEGKKGELREEQKEKRRKKYSAKFFNCPQKILFASFYAITSTLFLLFSFKRLAYLSIHEFLSIFSTGSVEAFEKNKGAVFGLIVIALAVLVAIFAYFIAPDPSPFANRIILEIGRKKPGFEQSFIKIKKIKMLLLPVFSNNWFQAKKMFTIIFPL